MRREFEGEPHIEILPQNLGEMTGKEAVPILERASRRIEIVHGTKNELWEGVKENIDGLAAWIEANRLKLGRKSVQVISGAALTAVLLSACSPQGPAGQTYEPTGTAGPRFTDVSPTTRATKLMTPTAPKIIIATSTLRPTETATPTPTQTPEIVDYGKCPTPEFAKCPIPFGDFFNNKYLSYLRTLSTPFGPNIKFVPMVETTDGDIIYDPQFPHNYADASQRPFRRNVTSGITTYQGLDSMVLPVEYADPADPTNPEKNVWVIGIYPLTYLGDQLGKLPKPYMIRENVDDWMNGMDIMPIMESPGYPGVGDAPLVAFAWQQDKNMAQNVQDFKGGNVRALDGKLILTYATRGSSWYK